MFIKNIAISNFRLLRNVSLTLQKESTVIVGRNNSGKTSLSEIFRRFFSGKSPSFNLEDFSILSIPDFKDALELKLKGEEETTVRSKIPTIDLDLIIDYQDNKNDYGALSEFIIDLDENTTEAWIKISYKLKNGMIDAFFEGLTTENISDCYKLFKERIPQLFNVEITAIDPTDSTNVSVVEFTKLIRCLGADFINAQRGLDDVTQSEKDVLGKVLSSIFKSATVDTAPEEMKQKSKELEDVVKDIQGKVDTDFKDKVNALLPALSLFGYPGLSDPKLSTETTLDVKTILESNTKIRYEQDYGITLPETYNGLGSRNLIYILFQLFEFFRKYQSNPNQIQNHIIFVEEPEAHLHPQMQEVFIRKLNEIAKEFSKTMNNNIPWPVQFIVSTHSTHIANEASFDCIRYFLTNSQNKSETCIKDLNAEFVAEDRKDDKEFIYKYLTLTKCDLYFADKAMLIEGPTERLLMPELIRKTDIEITNSKLANQYISVVEIGGAYAHRFFRFLDFLEIKTLVITDLDSTKQEVTDTNKTVYKACNVSQGTHSSNAGIKNWFKENDDNVDLAGIRNKKDVDKIVGTRRIAFQIPEEGKSACGRSFEDAFMIANCALFSIAEVNDADIEAKAFDTAQDMKQKKTDFALQYALDDKTWNVPLYIKEGLIWLAEGNVDDNTPNAEEVKNA